MNTSTGYCNGNLDRPARPEPHTFAAHQRRCANIARAAHERDEAAACAAIEDGERAMAEMGLLR